MLRGNRMLGKFATFIAAGSLAITICGGMANAAPYNGKIFEVIQPDGSIVKVRAFGDEYYHRFESLDGYTLVKDFRTGYIHYARLNQDGSRFEISGHIYRRLGMRNSTPPKGLKKHLKMRRDAVSRIIASTYEMIHGSPWIQESMSNGGSSVNAPTTGNIDVNGLTILIDFPDVQATIPLSNLDDMLNQTGYTGYSNNGSVKDYYFDVSDGNVTINSDVQGYFRAPNNKDYYNGGWYPKLRFRARELVRDAIEWLDNQGFDFTSLDVDENGFLRSFGLMYAGDADMSWSVGLWPHAGSLLTAYTTHDGVKIQRYHMSAITNDPFIGTYCHETGHSVFGWPDFYDYDRDSSLASQGVGRYCLMGSGNTSFDNSLDKNPTPPSAYARMTAGWEDVQTLNGETGTFSIDSNENQSYIYVNPYDSAEYFLIESRTNTGRSLLLPDEGLLIWHVDTNGNRDKEDMTCSDHYVLSVEQADGAFNLENNNNRGDSFDLFDASNVNAFGSSTLPNSDWWCDGVSGLNITNISNIGATMTFDVH